MSFTVHRDIKSAPDHVFDVMADARNEPAWNSQVSNSSLDTGEPIGLGSRFTTVNRGKTYQATITTYDRPQRLAFEVTGSPMDITVTFRFGATSDGTAMTGDFDMQPKGVMKALFPLLRGTVRKDLDRQSASFAQLCETP